MACCEQTRAKTDVSWHFSLLLPPFYPLQHAFFTNRPRNPSHIPFSRKPFRRGVYDCARKCTVSGGGGGAGVFSRLARSPTRRDSSLATQPRQYGGWCDPVRQYGPGYPAYGPCMLRVPPSPASAPSIENLSGAPAYRRGTRTRWARIRAQLSKSDCQFTGSPETGSNGRARCPVSTRFSLFPALLSKRQGGATTRGDKER